MGTKTILQLTMIALALFLVFAVIMPKLDAIKVVQDEAAEYKTAVEKAELYNQQLAALLQKEQNFGKKQLDALDVYLPTTVDAVAIMADISAMTRDAGLTLTSLATADSDQSMLSQRRSVQEVRYDEDGEEIIVDEASLEHSDFTLLVQGDYESFKKFLTSIEFNKYQLEIVSLSMTKPRVGTNETPAEVSADAGYSFTITLRASSFTSN